MGVFNDLLLDFINKKTTTTGKELWSELNTAVTDLVQAPETAANIIIRKINDSISFADTYKLTMFGANTVAVLHNNGKYNIPNGGYHAFVGMESLVSVAMITDLNATEVVKGIDTLTGKGIQDGWEKVLVEPNIEGVPISTASISTERSVDISEQMVILQQQGEKKYWTDNAVPHLKEWQIEGYITSALTLDQRYMIKPSLDLQLDFLDLCVQSRQPVLFKTNRGKFVKVQITNLQTTEEASYNNAIKVVISLKEYNPYTVSTSLENIAQALDNINDLPMNQSEETLSGGAARR